MTKVVYLSVSGTQTHTFRPGPFYFDVESETHADGSFTLTLRRHRGIKRVRTWISWHLWRRWRRIRIRL